MTTTEPWAVGDTLPDPGHHLAIATMCADVKYLTAFKDTIEVTYLKAAFESVIAVLALVKARIFVLF